MPMAMLLCCLTGCSKFDASAYVKAILDNSYLNDSTAFVEQGIGTKEEAEEIYIKGIDAEMDAMLSSVYLSESLQEEYRTFYEEMFQSVRYSVGEAVKIDDHTMEVTITYEKLNIFSDAMESYNEKAAAMMGDWSIAALTGSEPSEQEMLDLLFMTLKDCMKESLNQANYDAANTTTIRVELEDNVWTPNQEDLGKLETLLFDFEGLKI